MKIILSGITGYIGTRLTERFLSEGHEMHAIVRKTSKVEELPDNIKQNVKFYVYDEERTILDIVTAISKDKKPDVVYHLASLYLASHKYSDIRKFIDSNITFGSEILDSMRANDIKNFINVGTFAQHYESREYNPVNFYSATKQSFEDILKFYVEVYGMKTISLHLFDTYGVNDKRRKIFNLFKEIGESGETLAMSPGEQLIDIVYIDDVINAFAIAGKYLVEGKYNFCGTYGVSSGNPIKLRELAKIFEKVSDKQLNIKWGGRAYREREIMIPWNTYKTLPGWKPEINLETGIKMMYNSR